LHQKLVKLFHLDGFIKLGTGRIFSIERCLTDSKYTVLVMKSVKIYTECYEMLKFDALCSMDLEARQRLMLPSIERLLRHTSVPRACIVKLYRDEVLDIELKPSL